MHPSQLHKSHNKAVIYRNLSTFALPNVHTSKSTKNLVLYVVQYGFPAYQIRSSLTQIIKINLTRQFVRKHSSHFCVTSLCHFYVMNYVISNKMVDNLLQFFDFRYICKKIQNYYQTKVQNMDCERILTK